MSDDTLTIYVWSDNSWESEEEIDDIDWYLSSSGKSDDYATYEVPLELEAEDIDELIELEALPGMIPEKTEFPEGIIELPKDAILIINHPKDISDSSVTILDGKMIINSAGLSIEVLKGGK